MVELNGLAAREAAGGYDQDEGLSYLEARLYGYRLIMDSLPELHWKIVDPRNDSVLDFGEGPLANAEGRLREAMARGWIAPINSSSGIFDGVEVEDCYRYPSQGAWARAYMEDYPDWESTGLPLVEGD